MTNYGITPISLSADLSTETLQARREWHDLFKVMKGKKLQPRILYPARLSFRFDGESKSFPDKQKLKRIQHHQTSFTTNAKGTSLGRKQEKENTYLQKINSTIKKTVIGIKHIHNYLKCKWIKCTNQKTQTGWVNENMHVCTSTYHITLLDPPNCM